MSHIACLDASDAEDEPGLVEDGTRSPSLILNSLHLNLHGPAVRDFDSILCSPFSVMG